MSNVWEKVHAGKATDQLVEAALALVGRLCKRETRDWRMSIPPQWDDADALLSGAIRRLRDERDQARAELAEVRKGGAVKSEDELYGMINGIVWDVLRQNIACEPATRRILALMTNKPSAGAGGWVKEPPTKQGHYWHWSGDPDSAPLPYSVLVSGTDGRAFMTAGQYGRTHAIDCAGYGGWWLPCPTPSTPPADPNIEWRSE